MSVQERNICPEYFQDYLTYLGGVTKYDTPNFKLVWSQYETFTSGGKWSVDEATFVGYRQLPIGNEPCWAILQWHAPEEYGSPEAFYVSNIDEETGLQILGEYGYSGRYELLYNLRWHERGDDGRLHLHSFPLETWIIDMIIPIVMAAKDVSLEKRKAAYLDAKERAENEKLVDIERHLHDNAVPFTGSVSYGRQGIRSTVIDEKMIALQREWGNLQSAARKFRPGHQTG